jgi:hypothetical protein
MNELKVTASHLRRTAVIYVRQSTLAQAPPRSGRPATVATRGPARRPPAACSAGFYWTARPPSCAGFPKWPTRHL